MFSSGIRTLKCRQKFPLWAINGGPGNDGLKVNRELQETSNKAKPRKLVASLYARFRLI